MRVLTRLNFVCSTSHWKSNYSKHIVCVPAISSLNLNPKMPERRKEHSKLVSFTYDMLAGGISGMIAKTSAAPIDRVKLLLQTQYINPNIEKQYKGPIDCAKRLWKEEGFLSFFRGNLANLYRYFPNQAITFAFKDQYKEYFVGKPTGNPTTDRWRVVIGSLVSGGLAGASAVSVSYPFEVARTRLAVDMGRDEGAVGKQQTRQYKGTLDCMRTTYRLEGIRGIYAGIMISLFGVVLFRGLFLGGYDTVKYVFDIEKGNVGVRLIAAQAVTTITGTLTYPIDTIKRRMMIQKGNVIGGVSSDSKGVVYRNSWHCFRTMIKEEGIRGLYNGLSANLMRSLSGALLLVGYDEIKKLFQLV